MELQSKEISEHKPVKLLLLAFWKCRPSKQNFPWETAIVSSRWLPKWS